MATKMIYSNNLDNVNAKIAEVITETFRKKFIFKTSSALYYVYGDKRYNTENEARNALMKLGYKNDEIKIVEQWGGYRYISFCAILEGTNSEWVDFIFLQTPCKIKEQGLFELSNWGAKVIRVYCDFKFKSFYKQEDTWFIDSQKGLYYNRQGSNVSEVEEDYGLRNKADIFCFLPLSVNDISSDYLKSMQNYNNYRRDLSKESKQILLRVFNKADETKVKTYTSVREFIRRPGIGSCAKASETKRNLIENEFIPILNKIEQPKELLDEAAVEKANARGFKYNYNGDYNRRRSCFHRVKDWIVFSDGSEKFFYNVKTTKRYLVNFYDCNSWRSNSCNIGVFRASDLICSLSQYGKNIHYDTVSFYLNGQYNWYSEKRNEVMQIPIKEIEYICAPKCYDENNNEISPLECFDGTIATDFLKIESDWEYNILVRGNKKKCGTFADLIALNRCPGIAFLLLCIKNDRRVMAEQLYKLKLNGMLIQLLVNPDSFKEKSENNDEVSYWRRSPIFCSYDKKGTNLKKMFNVSMDKIKAYDNMLKDEYEKTLSSSTNVPPVSTIQEILGDAFINLDNNTFVEYLNYGRKYILTINNIKELKPHIIDGRSPKEIISTLNRIGNMGTFCDYLKMRTQYFNYFDEFEAEQLKRVYKTMPGKAKKFKYLREKRRPYWEEKIISVEEQYNSLVNTYKNVQPIYGERGGLIGVQLELSEQEHIKYLHDELSDFITAHQKELQAKGFRNAAERLLKYEYKGKELSIVSPKESTELAIEGGVLSHCVAGFIDPVIRGTENVLFIRRNDMIDKPYYTLAISNSGHIEQIHCYRNGDLTVKGQEEAYKRSELEVYNKPFDLIKFLREWANAKKGLVVPSTIKEVYGALGANR